MDEMNPEAVPIDYNDVHLGGQSCIFWPKMTWNIGVMITTFQFKPFNNENQLQYGIYNKAL